MKLISCTANIPLAESIADYLDVPLTERRIERFADNEVFIRINENVRGEDIYVIQSTSFPANDTLMELLICLDALKRASAQRITAVIPYYGYARQDRKTDGRTPISAKLVANLIVAAGADRVLTMDLHAGQLQGFFDVPTDNLIAAPVIEDDIRKRFKLKSLIIVSPDVGGVVRARSLAKRLAVDLAIVDKRRAQAGVSEVMNIIGDVKGRNCILVDDICDSGGTLRGAAEALKKQGATGVSAYVTHGVFSTNAIENFEGSQLDEIVACDTIQQRKEDIKSKKLRVLTVAPLLGEAIRRIANKESVSKLFD
ncbi:MAG: ribose-phosphate pyrophosphokinase [Pseudomonadota bacterium]